MISFSKSLNDSLTASNPLTPLCSKSLNWSFKTSISALKSSIPLSFLNILNIRSNAPVVSAIATPKPNIRPIIVVFDTLSNAIIAIRTLLIASARPIKAFVILKTTTPIPIALMVSKFSAKNLKPLPTAITAFDKPLPIACATLSIVSSLSCKASSKAPNSCLSPIRNCSATTF